MNIYEDNAFRILGLPVTSDRKVIVQRYDELQVYIQMGKVPTYDIDIPWIVDINRTDATIRKAFQDLDKPITKLKHAIVWFWKKDHIDQMAFSSLEKENLEQAESLWEQSLELEKKNEISYMKNIASLNMLILFNNHISSRKELIFHLRNYIKTWSNLINEDRFWQELIKINNSNNLDQETRDKLQKYILDVIIKSIFSNQKNMEIFSEFLRIIINSDFPDRIKENFINNLYEKKIRGIESEIQNSIDKRTHSPEQAIKIANKLIKKTEKDLDFLNSFSEKDEFIRNIFDKLAIELLYCGLAFEESDTENKSDELKLTRNILLNAEEIANDTALKMRIRENLNILDKNIAYFENFEICWYCKIYNPNDSSAVKIDMYKVTGKDSYGIYYNRLSPTVPRCEFCEQSHKNEVKSSRIGAIIGLVFGGLIGLLVDTYQQNSGICLIGGLIGGFIGFIIGGNSGRDKEIKPKSQIHKFPIIEQLLSEGWQLGEKPKQ